MAIFRHLRTLISQSTNNRSKSAISRPFFSFCTQQSVASLPRISAPFLLSGNAHIRRHFLFRSEIHFPVVGPLFLSNPPWKLLQSSTPLILRSDTVLNLLKLRALDLLQSPGFKYPLGDHRLLNKDGILKVGSDVGADHSLLWESYFNLPNYISLGRLLSGPVIASMIMHEMYSPAFFALSISGASDWLDGYVARKMRIDSVVGSYLDPLADKVLIGCVALAMIEKDLLHPGLVALVLARDVALLGGALYNRASTLNWQLTSWRLFFDLNGTHSEKMKPLFISKVNTFFQLILVAAALLQPAFGNDETQLYINILSLLVACTTLSSTAAYGLQLMKSGASIGKQAMNSRT